MARLGCRFSTPTPTPTDSWASYFDSWKSEDLEVPTSGYEPMIVDDELHPDNYHPYRARNQMDARDFPDGMTSMGGWLDSRNSRRQLLGTGKDKAGLGVVG
ncbi:hypothetical protein LTS15_008859 [Exophiala xenobiotica]|nr:hypothetical protein LTS15_008859 [Exophiala xenobiotica]